MKPDPIVKELGDKILNDARDAIKKSCGTDEGLKFLVNRWVYARLQLDERQAKQPYKKHLWTHGSRQCAECGVTFATMTGVEIHRIDHRKPYSVENCALVCKTCHRKIRDV